jgi:hypothetical protein
VGITRYKHPDGELAATEVGIDESAPDSQRLFFDADGDSSDWEWRRY